MMMMMMMTMMMLLSGATPPRAVMAQPQLIHLTMTAADHGLMIH